MTGILGSLIEVISSAGSAARARHSGSKPVAPARAVIIRTRRRVCHVAIGSLPKSMCSRLELAFCPVREAPVARLGDVPLGPMYSTLLRSDRQYNGGKCGYAGG